MTEHSGPGGGTELVTQTPVVDESLQGATQLADITGPDHQAGPVVLIDPRHSCPELRGDHWATLQHGLELHHPEGFLTRDRRQDEGVALVVPPHELGARDLPQETHTIGAASVL